MFNLQQEKFNHKVATLSLMPLAGLLLMVGIARQTVRRNALG